MSKGRKRKNANRTPPMQCVAGHCNNPMRKGFEWTICRTFMTMVKNGKTPSANCPYYK